MNERKEPTLAPGQELTLHPGDPVRGADLLAKNLPEAEQEPPRSDRPENEEAREIRF